MYITTTRSELTAASTAGFAPPDGAVWAAAGLRYLRRATADMIPDLPGWEPLGDWDIRHFGAHPDAATAADARAVAIAIQAAYDAATAAGQPLHIGPGTWLIHMNADEIVTATGGYRIAPLRFAADGGVVRGAGMDQTIIRCFTGGAYSAIGWQRTPLQNGIPKIAGGLYAGFTVDGGVEDPSGATGGYAAALAANLDGVSFERVRFRNANQYGLGAQNGGHRRVTLTDCTFENTGYDGFDLKNNNPTGQPSVGWAFRLVRPRFHDCCRGTYSSPGAWCDIMGEGCQVTDPIFSGLGATGNALSLLRIKQGLDSQNTRGLGGWRSIVEGMQVEYSAASPITRLVEIRAPYAVLADLRQSGDDLGAAMIGVQVWQPWVSIIRPRLKGAGTGIGVSFAQHGGSADGYAFTGGDNGTVQGGVFAGLATGISTNRARLCAFGNAFPDCTTGISGGTQGVLSGNDFTGSTTPYALTGDTNRVTDNIADAGLSIRSVASPAGTAALDLRGEYRLGITAPGGTWRERLRIATLAGAEDAVTRLQVEAATDRVDLSTLGSGADIDLRLVPQGSGGRVRFGTHEAAAPAVVTGFIETRDAGGTLRRLAVTTPAAAGLAGATAGPGFKLVGTELRPDLASLPEG
jgi:hypothetical protein